MTLTPRDRVLPRLIEDEMRESFIDYSMSVIVQRALPDVRDGLKPVHRRILYAMHELGLNPARPYKKCATVVGDVLGKYHPHGDTAVYDSLVRMVQDFSLRYPLIDGQGNFGSIDGDNPAAYRYTEARLAPVAVEMLADIDRATVDYAPNYDDRLEEPTVLPARLPNLLVNGSSGIAVGMSTNIPPHNVGEVVAAALHLLDHPECTVDDLMEHLPGPDFPTGGLIVGTKGIRDAYTTGRGRVVMRARVFKESRRTGKEQLVVTEIPYGTNKSRIIEQIAELTRGGKTPDIAELRDESDRDGIRIVIELKRGTDAVKVLNQLFKWTGLQSTFGVISLALDRGVPREFPLKDILARFRDHRVEVVVRRSRWEVERARDEAHLLEGLLVALKRIDEVVSIIRSSRTRESAARKLERELKLTERQSEAILAMRLSRLTQLETRELRDRLEGLAARIRELDALLADPAKQLDEVRRELLELSTKYGDPRRTTLYESEKSVRLEDLLAAEEVIVTVSREGYLNQIPMSVYQRRMSTGRGLSMEQYENDFVERAFVASTQDVLLFFTGDGRVNALDVRDVPENGGRGKRLHALFEWDRRAEVAGVARVREFAEGRFLLFATADGSVKRTGLEQYANAFRGIEACGVKPGDRVVDVRVTDGEGDVVLVGRGGRAIRFAEAEVPVQGRTAQGVRGIKLKDGEALAGFASVRHDGELLAVTEKGWGKRVSTEELPVQGRGGQGAALHSATKESGPLVSVREWHPGEDVMAVTAVGRTLRLKGDDAPASGRSGGVEVLGKVSTHDRIVSVSPVAEREPAPDAEDAVVAEVGADASPLAEEPAAESAGGEELDLFS